MYIILGLFCRIFGENYVFYVIIYIHVLVLYLGMVLWWYL